MHPLRDFEISDHFRHHLFTNEKNVFVGPKHLLLILILRKMSHLLHIIDSMCRLSLNIWIVDFEKCADFSREMTYQLRS